MTQYIYFKTAISILLISSHDSFRVLFDKIASVYILFEKYIHILALEMTSPRNRHCANWIGTLSFPVNLFCEQVAKVLVARGRIVDASCDYR